MKTKSFLKYIFPTFLAFFPILICLSTSALARTIDNVGSTSQLGDNAGTPVDTQTCPSSSVAPASVSIVPITGSSTVSVSFGAKNDIDNIIQYDITVKNIDTSPARTVDTRSVVSLQGMATFETQTLTLIPGSKYQIDGSFSNLSKLQCSYDGSTNTSKVVDLTSTDDTGSNMHGSISLSADPTTLSLKNDDGTLKSTFPSTNFSYSFSGHETGELYHLYISGCNGTFYDHLGMQEVVEGKTYNPISWQITDKSCNSHTAYIKTFTIDGILTGKSSDVTITVLGSDQGDTPTGGTTPGEDVNKDESFNLGELGLAFQLPKSYKNLGDIFQAIGTILLDLIAGLSVLGIMIGGVQYITAGGDSNKAEKAKKTLLYCIIGVLLATLSLVLINVIINTASNGVT